MSFGDLKVQDLIYEDSSNNEITVVIANLATKANPVFSGTVTVPTATAGDNSTKAASTAFVVASFAPKNAPAFTGSATGVNLTLSGDLTVNGTTTTINTTTLQVEDKNIEIGKVSSPSDTTADGGGWTLLGSTNKTFNWLNATDSWTSSEHIEIASGKNLKVDGTTFFVDGTNNRVGIGTVSPATELHVQDSSGDCLIRVTSADGSGAFLDLGDASDPDGGRIVYDTGSNLILCTASSERMRIDSAGRVGIGTQSPVGGDLVVENTTGNAGVALSRVFNGNVSGATNTPSFAFTMSDTATNDQVVASISPQALAGTGDAFKGQIRVFTAAANGTNTERFRIGDSGQLGIGGATYGTSGQVLTSGGSGAAPSWADAAGGSTVDVVASGTLATDDAVFFNVSGTVSKVVLTSVSDSVGSSVDARGGVSNSVSQWEFDSCRISDTTFAICWEKDGIKVVVGTISGTSISFGTILNTGNGTSSGNDFPLIDYCAKSGCIALAYKNGSNLSMRAIGVSGNSLTEGSQATKSVNFGTSFALACGNSRYGAAGPTTGGLVYGRGSSSSDAYIYDFTISGTTVTIGANATGLNRSSDLSNTFRSANMIYCPLRDGYVITYTDDTSGFDKYLWMDSLTRNSNNASPTFRDNGGPLAASSMSGSNPSTCTLAYDSEYQNIAVGFTDNNNHTKVRKINFQSNYDLTDYDPVTIEYGSSAVINMMSLVYQREIGAFYCLCNNTTDGRVDLFKIDTNTNGTTLSYPSDSSHRTNSIVSHASDKITLAAVGNGTIVTTIPSSNGYQVNSTARQYAHTSKNVTPSVSNFLGFSDGNYTNGQTAKIKIVGNTTTQSSLSAMTTYYITDNGTVSSTEGSPSIKAGYAINSTTMIITPQYMY